jgi:hypothetical protein
MNEEWLFPNAVVPVDAETTAALVVEIHRLIDVVGGMALAQPPQRTWVGLTDDEIAEIYLVNTDKPLKPEWLFARAIEDKLKERNQ